MRVITGLVVLGVALAAAPSAALAAEPMCPVPAPGSFDASYQARLSPLITQGMTTTGPDGFPVIRTGPGWEAATSVLGGQFVMLRLVPQRQGWAVAFSPGAHDATTARAAIQDHLATRVSAEDATYLLDTLALEPTPYSQAELDVVFAQVGDLMRAHAGLMSSAGIGCTVSDGVRVQVSIGVPDTPEQRAEAEALLAPFGDKVRVQHGMPWAVPAVGQAPGPLPKETKTPLRVRDHVTLPPTARCVRGAKLAFRPAKGATVTLKAGSRRVTARSGKRATLKLTRRVTRVQATVRRGGASATAKLTYRRCGKR